jgi:hypothetical protein
MNEEEVCLFQFPSLLPIKASIAQREEEKKKEQQRLGTYCSFTCFSEMFVVR